MESNMVLISENKRMHPKSEDGHIHFEAFSQGRLHNHYFDKEESIKMIKFLVKEYALTVNDIWEKL